MAREEGKKRRKKRAPSGSGAKIKCAIHSERSAVFALWNRLPKKYRIFSGLKSKIIASRDSVQLKGNIRPASGGERSGSRANEGGLDGRIFACETVFCRELGACSGTEAKGAAD